MEEKTIKALLFSAFFGISMTFLVVSSLSVLAKGIDEKHFVDNDGVDIRTTKTLPEIGLEGTLGYSTYYAGGGGEIIVVSTILIEPHLFNIVFWHEKCHLSMKNESGGFGEELRCWIYGTLKMGDSPELTTYRKV